MTAPSVAPAVATDAGTLIERADASALVAAWVAEAAEAGALDEGALPDWLADLVALAEADLKTKAERAGLALRRLGHDVDAIDAELKVLQARKQARAREQERLRAYLHASLLTAGEPTIKTPLVTVALQENPPAVHGTLDEATLWDLARDVSPFVRVTPATVSLVGRAVLDAHRARQPIPDGLTVERALSLRVR